MPSIPSLSFLRPVPFHLRVGREGERTAACYLRSLGYRLLGRNVKVGRRLEIDFVAYDPEDRVIVFAEVKACTLYSSFYPPDRNFTPRKREMLTRAARIWLSRRRSTCGFRLDLICVVGGEVAHHLRDIAFTRGRGW